MTEVRSLIPADGCTTTTLDTGAPPREAHLVGALPSLSEQLLRFDAGRLRRYVPNVPTIAAITTEELILSSAERIAREFAAIATSASSEEDVRHGCNSLLDQFLRDANISVTGKHEYGLAGGRIDSKYGGVIIEYKASKGSTRIADDIHAAATRALVGQLKRRFVDFQKDESIHPERLFAVGCDAHRFVFVRHRGGQFEVEQPQGVSPITVERLLRALVSLGAHGKSFTPDHLETDFGADSELAKDGVGELYAVLKASRDTKVRTLFEQWKVLFSEVCGYDVENASEYLAEVADHYHVKNPDPPRLLFAIHTYYAIVMKFLAAEIASSFSPIGAAVLKKCRAATTSDKLRRELATLEQGGIWSQLGVTNFLEGDLFAWYLSAWCNEIVGTIRRVVECLDGYDPTTLSVDPAESRDLLKHLYQRLFPQTVRHALGEYYTPDWLAEFTLDELGYTGNPDARLLDPACGSGTFLVMAINRAKAWFTDNRARCGYDESGLLSRILANIVGFDLNPLAVMAARTNVLLAIRDLLRFAASVELPVYLCDSVLTPAEHGKQYAKGKGAGADLWSGYQGLELKTSVGRFIIPREISTSRELMATYADVLEHSVRHGYSTEEFLARCADENIPTTRRELHVGIYSRLLELRGKRDGIWARIIKNAFAPLFVGKVDYVVGNPPWINWESLPEDYREDTEHVWRDFDLLTLKGWKARVAAGRSDISILFVVMCLDQYVKKGGGLGFVINQSIFKSTGGGEGFRAFKLRSATYAPVRVHDFSGNTIFEDAVNRVAVVVFERDRRVQYPVPYVEWRPLTPRNRLYMEDPKHLPRYCSRVDLLAIPSIPGKPLSPWLTGSQEVLTAVGKVLGVGEYRAREGVNWGGALGVYQLSEVTRLTAKKCLITNDARAGRIKFDATTAPVESELVFPLVKGRDIHRWHATVRRSILATHPPGDAAAKAIPVSTMKVKYHQAYEYLASFQKQLASRKEYKRWGGAGPFYELYRIGPYTFAPFKVVFKDLTDVFQCCVISPDLDPLGRVVIPDYTLRTIACEDEQSAHFVAAVLNSAPATVALHATSVGVQTQRYHPGDIDKIALPRFVFSDPLHLKLVELSKACHRAATDHEDVAPIEREIDQNVAKLWRLSKQELAALSARYDEIRSRRGGSADAPAEDAEHNDE